MAKVTISKLLKRHKVLMRQHAALHAQIDDDSIDHSSDELKSLKQQRCRKKTAALQVFAQIKTFSAEALEEELADRRRRLTLCGARGSHHSVSSEIDALEADIVLLERVLVEEHDGEQTDVPEHSDESVEEADESDVSAGEVADVVALNSHRGTGFESLVEPVRRVVNKVSATRNVG